MGCGNSNHNTHNPYSKYQSKSRQKSSEPQIDYKIKIETGHSSVDGVGGLQPEDPFGDLKSVLHNINKPAPTPTSTSSSPAKKATPTTYTSTTTSKTTSSPATVDTFNVKAPDVGDLYAIIFQNSTNVKDDWYVTHVTIKCHSANNEQTYDVPCRNWVYANSSRVFFRGTYTSDKIPPIIQDLVDEEIYNN